MKPYQVSSFLNVWMMGECSQSSLADMPKHLGIPQIYARNYFDLIIW